MRTFLIALFISAFSYPALAAADWVEVLTIEQGANKGTRLYLDRHNIITSNSEVTFWTKTAYSPPLNYGKNSSAKGQVYFDVTQEVLNCQNRISHAIYTAFYNQSGQVVVSGSAAFLPSRTVIPDTIFDKLYDLLCK